MILLAEMKVFKKDLTSIKVQRDFIRLVAFEVIRYNIWELFSRKLEIEVHEKVSFGQAGPGVITIGRQSKTFYSWETCLI